MSNLLYFLQCLVKLVRNAEACPSFSGYEEEEQEEDQGLCLHFDKMNKFTMENPFGDLIDVSEVFTTDVFNFVIKPKDSSDDAYQFYLAAFDAESFEDVGVQQCNFLFCMECFNSTDEYLENGFKTITVFKEYEFEFIYCSFNLNERGLIKDAIIHVNTNFLEIQLNADTLEATTENYILKKEGKIVMKIVFAVFYVARTGKKSFENISELPQGSVRYLHCLNSLK